MAIIVEPDFLCSFDAMQRSLRALPNIDVVLPHPRAPDPAVVDAWLRRYRTWALPDLYVPFVENYGGVAESIPNVGVGIRPLDKLLEYRAKRESSGEAFATRQIPLSHANVEGVLRLVFLGDQVRVAFMNADDDIHFEADSFAVYLWTTVYASATIYEASHHEYATVDGIGADDLEDYMLRIATALGSAGANIITSDRRILTGQLDETRFCATVRGPTRVGMSTGCDRHYHAMMQNRADLITVMEATR